MIRRWESFEVINGEYYKIIHEEWDYYAGSRISTSRMEKINEEAFRKNQEPISKRRRYEKKQCRKTTMLK